MDDSVEPWEQVMKLKTPDSEVELSGERFLAGNKEGGKRWRRGRNYKSRVVVSEVIGLMNYLENVLDELNSKIERLGERISPVLLPPEAYDAGSPPYGNTDMGKFIVRLIERSMNMRNRVQDLGDRVGL